MYSSKKLLSALAVIVTAASLGASVANAKPAPAPQKSALFQNGDRWTAIGDSITHGGAYYTSVYLYYATRFPDRKITLFNAGNSGDDTKGGLGRYDWDIQPHKSTVATVMFGMNDVRREIYGIEPVTSELRGQRAYILEGYSSFMTKLVKRLQADGTRVILITPSIYDETAQIPAKSLTGVNGALAQCGKIATKLAKETGSQLIDFNGPMTEINARIQAKDPTASLIRPDRIHPGPLGNFVMTYLFLKGQQAPGVVSSVSIDAAANKVVKSDNARVEKLKTSKEGATFTLTEKALPYPVEKEQESALEWVPFNDEFNREILQVSGLAPGDYQLSIDGKEVRRFKAEELAAGVNLALEKNTPQALQAAGVLELVKEWNKQTQILRSVANFEFWNLGDAPHPIVLENIRARVEAEMAIVSEQLKDAPKEKYKADNYARYLKNKAIEAETAAKQSEISEKIHAAAQPQPLTYKLERVKP